MRATTAFVAHRLALLLGSVHCVPPVRPALPGRARTVTGAVSPAAPVTPPEPSRCSAPGSPYLIAPQGFLARWHAARAEASRTQVRVLLLGDSHVEDGALADRLRARLRGDAPDGGPGIVLPAAVHHHGPRSPAVTHGAWEIVRGLDDDEVSATGLGLRSLRPGDEIHLPRPHPGIGISVRWSGAHDTLTLGRDARALGRERLALPDEDPIVLRHRGPGALQVDAIALDASIGLSLDALGVVGARYAHLARWQRGTAFGDLLSWRRPALVLLVYGTNDAAASNFDPGRLSRDLGALLETAHATATAVLVVGAPDFALRRPAGERRAPEALATVNQRQRDLAAVQGAAFFDTRAWMGGPGAMARFVAEGLAWPDHIHLRPRGYAALADALADALAAPPCEAP